MTEKSPEEPRKSRFQIAWPGQDGKRRMQDLLHFFPLREPFGDGEALFLSLLETQVRGVRMPRSARKTSSGPGHIGKALIHGPQFWVPCLICRDEAEEEVGMAGEIFRAGFDRHIDALRMRRQKEGRRPGVVENGRDALFLGDRDDRRNILNFEALRARRLEKDQSRFLCHESI